MFVPAYASAYLHLQTGDGQERPHLFGAWQMSCEGVMVSFGAQ
jgi:hypothetical protein